MRPKIALSAKVEKSVENVLEHAIRFGFDAIDWSFHPNDFIESDLAERWLKAFSKRYPGVELRYHTPWGDLEIAHKEDDIADRAMMLLRSSLKVISDLGGKFLTIHIGLNPDGPQALCMERAKTNLATLVDEGRKVGVSVCLENLKNGQTSDPVIFKELIEASDADVTMDIGHALSSIAHKSEWPCMKFIEAVSPRIVNAHIYEAETHEHVGPRDLSVIGMPLMRLLETSCDWWVIELSEAEDVQLTRKLITKLLDNAEYGIDASEAISAE